VQETTQNRWAFIDRLRRSWGPGRPEDPAEPIPPEVAMIEPFRRRFSADIYYWQTLVEAIGQLANSTLISMLSKIASQGGNQNLWFIFYHFFYPAHEENLRWCEDHSPEKRAEETQHHRIPRPDAGVGTSGPGKLPGAAPYRNEACCPPSA
jgi:hypothetical protein